MNMNYYQSSLLPGFFKKKRRRAVSTHGSKTQFHATTITQSDHYSSSDDSKDGLGRHRAQRSMSALSLPQRQVDGRFHFRAFNFYPRTSSPDDKKDFVSSMNLEVTKHAQTMRPQRNSTSSTSAQTLDDATEEDDDDPDGKSFTSSVQVLPRQNSTGYDVYASGSVPFPRFPSDLPPDHEIFVSSLQDISGSWMEVWAPPSPAPSVPTSPVSKNKQNHKRPQKPQQHYHHQQQPPQQPPQQRQRHKLPQQPPPLPEKGPVGSYSSRNIADKTFRDQMKNRLGVAMKYSETAHSTTSLPVSPPPHGKNNSNDLERRDSSNSRQSNLNKNYVSTSSIYSDTNYDRETPKQALFQTSGQYPGVSNVSTPPSFLKHNDTNYYTNNTPITSPSFLGITSAVPDLYRHRDNQDDKDSISHTRGFSFVSADLPEQDQILDNKNHIEVREKRGIFASTRPTFSLFRKNDNDHKETNQVFQKPQTPNRKGVTSFFSFGASAVSADTKSNNNRHSSTSSKNRHSTSSTSSTIRDVDESSNLKCSCSSYHAHSFKGEHVNNDIVALKEKRDERLMTSLRLEETGKGDDSNVTWNIFWVPSLSFHPYVTGDPLVDFDSLWPSLKELRSSLKNAGVQQTFLRDDGGSSGLVTLAVTCGPVRVLRCLVELGFIRVDQLTHKSSGLLHLAVLARNEESTQYLMAAKVSPNTRDAAGLTADQVCFSPHLRKQLAPRYLLGKDVSRERTLVRPSLQDRESIFKLATSPESFADLQKKLQTLDFNVNTECDHNGDFLLHIACTRGLSQLPLLMALIKIQGADIELCNLRGMTSLMMAAAEGNCVLCDVLICLFGANPNKPNSLSGRSALHYAVEGNHRKTVECLIRRGADVNMEDHSGFRPDDIPGGLPSMDDCCEVIQFNRIKRLEMLSDAVKKGEVGSSQLLPYDMCVVDGEGHTLIMLAAIYNRAQSLHTLLNVSVTTINAQHSKTGMTALAIAAQMGNSHAVQVLLKYEACPTVADMNGYLPLHHAVLNNHEATVDVFISFFPTTYQGLYKACRLCKKTSIYEKLYHAWERRQSDIVCPKLLGCSLNGDAEVLYQLLDEGDNINPKSGTGNWPLYLAVENGHLDVVQLICERGGDICKRHPTTGATALHVAAKMGHQSIVAYLLQFCRPPPSPHKQKISPSSSSSSSSTFPFSISSSTTAFFTRPSTGDRSGNHTSSDNNSEGLPSRGGRWRGSSKRLMDINAVDKEVKTALQLAAERGFSRIVEKLLQHGATTAILDSNGSLVTCPQYEGVRIMIESHRQKHTQDVIKCILDKSRKSMASLEEIWLPFFDHHLRTKEGQTPLMVAVRTGRIPMVKFLLASALYKPTDGVNYEEENLSDTDSGVLDPSHLSPKEYSKGKDTFDYSGNYADDYKENRPSVLEEDGGHRNNTKSYKQHRLEQMLTDVSKPKGLSIYQKYGVVSHVCAVNLQDWSTCFHQAVEGADNLQLLELLLETDSTPLNVQDKKGETVLHLACRLARKKCVARLLECPGIDVNIRTLEGLLPEELSYQKSIYRLVEKARLLFPPPNDVVENAGNPSPAQSGSHRSTTRTESTINFEQLHSRYEELKMGGGGRGVIDKENHLINTLGSSL